MLVKPLQENLNADGASLNVDGDLGPATYTALFAHMGARNAALDLGDGAAMHFEKYGLNTPRRIAHWLAQFGHESCCFTKFEESLNYSARRLCQVWPRRFPNRDVAAPYANNPEALANKVYGGRMGNTQPGDGWKYRGRGPQLTGRDNYAAVARRTGLPLIEHPDLAILPENFVLIACDFWNAAACNAQADRDDLDEITLRINGGKIGINERRALLFKAKRVLEP